MSRFARLGVALALVALVGAACSDDSSGSSAPRGAEGDAAPSEQAASICEPMVRDGVEDVAGDLLGAPVATLAGDVYTCRYEITGGRLRLAVEDMETRSRARQFIDGLAGSADAAQELSGLGDGGVEMNDGSIVLLKDEYVLTIDVTELPPDALERSIAFGTAEAVMGCW